MKLLQPALQRLFLKAEALLNTVFGDRLNPMYHLGEIAFFLFWVVGASGLYLYAFFETGVAEAYASVQALTHGQWWAGGILRSVHRYASDAMVAVMLLHMLRHFAFDRMRGFRAFSWLTGVALIWMVYVSGVNGYMLPWDRLAQYVTITSFEWLDGLPLFGGALMRNFVHAASVTDRLFSLLSFIHIGAPLVVLLLMLVHVQRVPKARTQPPRPVALALTATLLALSIALPVTSQGGPADLATAVAEVRLDWFYLALFPLLADGPAAWTWGGVAGATALLALLPWWPRRRGGAPAAPRVLVHGGGPESFELHPRPGETLLEAGLREGRPLPHACRNGGCGLCLCRIERGSVEHRPSQPGVLTEAMRAQGLALSCCAVATTDLVVDLTPAPAAGLRTLTATVTGLRRLAPEVMLLRLALPPGERMDWQAGQYLNVVLEDGQRRAFSFAGAPGDQTIELHVRRVPGGRFTGHVFDALRAGDRLQVEGPLGGFSLREGERPIVFIAGATGFAPVKSILEDALARGVRRPMRLYWGARHREDLYLLDLPLRWARQHPQFSFVPVLSEPQPRDRWSGRTGLVHEALLADFPDLAGYDVYVCGSLRMVDAALPVLGAHGLEEGACFSDAFFASGTPASA